MDIDEEGYSNGPVTETSFERRDKVDGSLVAVCKPCDTDTIAADKPQASIEIKPSTVSEMNKINNQGKSDVSLAVSTEKSPIFSFATASTPSIMANASGLESTLRPHKIDSSEVPKAATAPIFGFGDKLPSQKEPISSSLTFAFGNKVATLTNEQNAVPVSTNESNVAPTQQASVSTTFKFGDKATFAATENGNKNAGSPFKFESPLVNEKESAEVGSASVFKADRSSSRSVCLLPTFVLFILLFNF